MLKRLGRRHAATGRGEAPGQTVGGTPAAGAPGTWPNDAAWSAEVDEQSFMTESGPRFTWVVQCGQLAVPSGKLVACDPFAAMRPGGNAHVVVPAGRYPVTVTLADVSNAQDRSHVREAYATLRIASGVDAYRKALPLVPEGSPRPELGPGEFIRFPVDAGTACFVDDWSVANCMPPADAWYPGLFETGPDAWFDRMDDPSEIREGIANIVLPLARNGENILIFHSGWGDGVYPVVGSFDASGRLLAVHIDFGVVV